jgi:hypothetical protein
MRVSQVWFEREATSFLGWARAREAEEGSHFQLHGALCMHEGLPIRILFIPAAVRGQPTSPTSSLRVIR